MPGWMARPWTGCGESDVEPGLRGGQRRTAGATDSAMATRAPLTRIGRLAGTRSFVSAISRWARRESVRASNSRALRRAWEEEWVRATLGEQRAQPTRGAGPCRVADLRGTSRLSRGTVWPWRAYTRNGAVSETDTRGSEKGFEDQSRRGEHTSSCGPVDASTSLRRQRGVRWAQERGTRVPRPLHAARLNDQSTNATSSDGWGVHPDEVRWM